MINISIRHQIIQYIEKASIKIEEHLNDRGKIVYVISSNLDQDLRVSCNLLERGINIYKKFLGEKFEKDYASKKPLPSKIIELDLNL